MGAYSLCAHTHSCKVIKVFGTPNYWCVANLFMMVEVAGINDVPDA